MSKKPRNITLSGIRRAKHPFVLLQTFVLDAVYSPPGDPNSTDHYVQKLPPGLRDIWYLTEFVGNVSNGGIAQVIENLLGLGDSTGIDICNVINSLHRLSPKCLYPIMKDLVLAFPTVWPSAILNAVHENEGSTQWNKRRNATVAPTKGITQKKLAECDKRFYKLHGKWVKEVDDQIRRSPARFVEG